MGDMYRVVRSDELMHYGVLGMKWGVRRARRNQKKYSKKYQNKDSKASELANQLAVSKNPSQRKINKYKNVQDKANKYDRKLSKAIDKEKELSKNLSTKIERGKVTDYSKRLKKMVKKVSKESEKIGGEIRGKKIINYDHPKFKEANKYLKDSAIEYSKTKEFDRLAKQYMDSFDKYGLPKNIETSRKLSSQITDNIRNLTVQKHAKELLALDMKYSGYDTNKKNVNDMYEAWNKHAPYSVEEIVKESNYNVSSGNKNIANNANHIALNEWYKRNGR